MYKLHLWVIIRGKLKVDYKVSKLFSTIKAVYSHLSDIKKYNKLVNDNAVDVVRFEIYDKGAAENIV